MDVHVFWPQRAGLAKTGRRCRRRWGEQPAGIPGGHRSDGPKQRNAPSDRFDRSKHDAQLEQPARIHLSGPSVGESCVLDELWITTVCGGNERLDSGERNRQCGVLSGASPSLKRFCYVELINQSFNRVALRWLDAAGARVLTDRPLRYCGRRRVAGDTTWL